MKIGIPISINGVLWGLISLLRVIVEKFFSSPPRISNRKVEAMKHQLVVCIPAHNEAKTISCTIKSIITQVPKKQVFVVSDGSTDNTAKIAKRLGCRVLELVKPYGKARALQTLIVKFSLTKKYKFILFVDADTLLDKDYVKRALKALAQEPSCAVIAGYAIPLWENPREFSKKSFISAYRTRLYQVLQAFIMYGQTWKYTNVNPVIPGFASIYKSDVLKKLNLVTSGVLIEDFNLAFQVHKKNLGFIGHYPTIKAFYHDPINFGDYAKQVMRWNVGFYQTIRKQGIWPSFFWLTTMLISLEILLYSLFIILLPLMIIFVLGWMFIPDLRIFPQWVYSWSIFYLRVYLSILILDYAVTLFLAFLNKRVMLIIYGPFFVIFTFINALVLIFSVLKGLLTTSSGVWRHAAR